MSGGGGDGAQADENPAEKQGRQVEGNHREQAGRQRQEPDQDQKAEGHADAIAPAQLRGVGAESGVGARKRETGVIRKGVAGRGPHQRGKDSGRANGDAPAQNVATSA
ncbi:hypothetical protein [Rhodoblastus sp.]|uniref:hypothetical protein n=1 Tax=Rhodoblastus sp. TaxID=1962975 RepID=UPI0026177360|nr:hypothetical protein [Rhodoblastus sp.]